MTPQPDPISSIPALIGSRCDALLVQQFWMRGELVSSANVLLAKFEGVWFRVCLDGGVVFWRSDVPAPAALSVPEEGWDYPHVDVATPNGLIGQTLSALSITETAAGCKIVFTFSNGRVLLFEEAHDECVCAVT